MSSTYRSTIGNDADWTDEDRIFQTFNGYRSTNTEYVCAKYLYTNDFANKNMTVRRCVAKTLENQSACTFINKTYPKVVRTIQQVMGPGIVVYWELNGVESLLDNCIADTVNLSLQNGFQITDRRTGRRFKLDEVAETN
ncbi:hypothetical protein JTB14_000923 [Gonioctena quinquepunctata]|nr:hypothetical protein JTB14_000923 [Gonioctena quinquepunctata]